MEKIYFRAGHNKAAEVLAEWEQTQDEVRKIKGKIESEFKADALYMSGDRPIGFVVAGHNHEKKGFKTESITEGGKDYTVFKPNQRFKQGKRFAYVVGKYNRALAINPKFSGFVTTKYGVDRMVVGPHNGSRPGRALYSSSAGIAKSYLVIIVPCDDKHPTPDLPDFEQIKKSQFIALTEE